MDRRNFPGSFAQRSASSLRRPPFETNSEIARMMNLVSMLRTDPFSPYIFPNFVYRGNVIRHIDLRIPVGLTVPSYGIYATTIGNGIVEQNIVDVSAGNPLIYQSCGKLTHMDNTTSNGASIHGANLKADQSTEPIDDIEIRIADALSMALL